MQVEGLNRDELFALPELEELVVTGSPIVFSVGPAEVLAEFSWASDGALAVALAVVEGGEGGVLRTLFRTVEIAAMKRGAPGVIWQVHAANCAQPNVKLTPLLESFQFERVSPKTGPSYYERRISSNDTILRRS